MKISFIKTKRENKMNKSTDNIMKKNNDKYLKKIYIIIILTNIAFNMVKYIYKKRELIVLKK